jgi:nucleoid DNA-binding protein
VKFDDLLAQYLYEHKTLQLQGIGSFELDKAVNTNHEQDKGVYYPIEGLAFTYNTKENTPEELITFLVKKLGKITPLVRSDLDSYLSNIKQFLNIGKPYTIEGVGTLHKNNQGSYEFTPGTFLPVKEELSPKREKTEPSLKPKAASTNGGKTIAIIIIIIASLAVLGGIGWGVSTFFINKDQANEEPVQGDELAEDTTGITAGDTTTTRAPGAASTNPNDTASFKMIFEVTNSKARAITRTNQLIALKIRARYDTVTRASGTQYRIFVTKRLFPADTTRVRDSIAKFFLRRVLVEREVQ